MPVYKKKVTDENVFDAAKRRFHELYDRFDKVVVSFSGGKDSTATFQMALEVAEERGKLPLDMYFFDEEAIHPETIDYMHRVAARDDVNLRWYCVPIRHRNACSRMSPWWFCWDPSKKDLWVRELPEQAIMTCPGFKWGDTMPHCVGALYGPEHGTVVHARGIRAAESLRRYRSVAQKIEDNWITGLRAEYGRFPNVVMASPLYDWSNSDVWEAPRVLGWDYNRAYDVLDKAGVPVHNQRVCPPYGEEPLRGLYQYAECWPDMWHKMLARVPGAATAARYSKTQLYAYGKVELPVGKTWESWFWNQLRLCPAKERAEIAGNIQDALRLHTSKTGRDIPMEEPDLVTGVSWKALCMLALRGDLKNRRIQQLELAAQQRRYKMGITLEEALELGADGKTRH